MKKFFTILLAAALLLCLFALPVLASDNVVYHDSNSSDANDGLSPTTPKKSLGSLTTHLVGLIPNGGTIVTVGKSYIGQNYTFPKTSGPVTFTSVWDGVDYKNPEPKSNPACAFKMASGATFTIESELIFDDIILFQENKQNTVIVKDGGFLTITDKVVCMSKQSYYWKIVVEEGGKAVINGGTFSSISGDGDITIAENVNVLDKPKPVGPADGDIVAVFHNSNSKDENDGLTPATPKKSLGSLSSGLVSMIPRGGTIVTVGKSYISRNYTFPLTSGPVTFTSVWEGVDYKNPEPATNPNCAFKMASGATFTLQSDLIFDDIILFQENAQNTIHLQAGATLIVTDTVVLMSRPDKDYHYKLILDEGTTAILSEKAQSTFTIENNGGEILTYVSSAPKTEVKLQIGNMTGYVNGTAKTLDAAPIIRNSRTMLPVRFVAENLGATVGWDGATSTVTVTTDTTKLEIRIGAATAKINGKEVTLDSPAFIENSRTYLPVRFVAENLGATVDWDGATSTATLTK